LEIDPACAEAHQNLGRAFQDLGRLDEALACYRRALEVRPGFAEAHANLGNALKDQGDLDAAILCYRRALELKPDFAAAHSNLIYAMHLCPGQTAQSIYAEYRQWNEQHAQPLAESIRSHPNDRSPDRRLRIGYVSPDLRQHPVGRFLLPLLAAHDHQAVEVFCYSSVRFPDAVTDQCRAGADVWRDVLPLSDEQVADAVRADRIDILVDLTMHMAGSRLLAFARKPAPVQVAYLAYCGTTGLAAMDYRFTDPYFDPPDGDRQPYSERSVWLPDTYWCYQPTTRTPLLERLPALKTGHITFGCLNNFCKVSEPTLDVWSRLLRTVRDSQLVLHAHAGSHRNRARDLFARQGVSPERVEFVGLLPLDEHFRTYQRIDIALDPFPCGGGTTTCDALWMGVPVVTRVGQTAVGRAGLSILSNLGLPELAARDADGYVRIAAQLAGDLPRLAERRATLRERMQRSPLMDAPRFARNVEAAYHEMWRRWCGGAGE
jgi:predicted O-linked N-acetylglucosamine transferase (SPINDLY family)